MLDDSNTRRLFADLAERMDALEERLAEIVEKLERIEEKLDDGNHLAVSTGPRRSSPLPLPGDPFDISDAISQAIQDTGAKSFTDMGRVIKAARGNLQRKGKSFHEDELLSKVRQIEAFQRK